MKSVAFPKGKLPFRDIKFLSDRIVVAVGYDCTPFLFEAMVVNDTVQSWSCKAELGGGDRPVNDAYGGEFVSQFTSGLAMFKAQTDLGLDGASHSARDTFLAFSPHGNCVQCIRTVVVCGASPNSFYFTTTALDGVFVLWAVQATPALLPK